MAMRVVHLIDHLGLGGSQTLLLDLLERRGPDIEPEVWTLRDRTLPKTAQRLRDSGVRLRYLSLSGLNPLRLRGLRASLAQVRPDLLHTHLDISNTLGAAVALTLGSARPRIVCHIENHPRLHYGRAARWLLGRVAARVDAYIVLSPSLREAAQPFLRGARRLEVIRPGIDLDRFDPAAVQPAGVRRLRGSASRVVGIVARLAEQKGIETLLDAIPRLLDAAPDTRVLVVGDGPSRAALEARARRLGIAAAVRLPRLSCRCRSDLCRARRHGHAVPPRGLRARLHRGHGHGRAGGRDPRRRQRRCGSGRHRPACWCRPTIPRRWRPRSCGCSTIRSCADASSTRPGAGCAPTVRERAWRGAPRRCTPP